MKKSERSGKVFIDWSQNDRHKTTIARVLAARPGASARVDAAALGGGRGAWRAARSGRARVRVPRRPSSAPGATGDPFAPVLELKQRAAGPLASPRRWSIGASPGRSRALPRARTTCRTSASTSAELLARDEPIVVRSTPGSSRQRALPAAEVVGARGLGRGQPRHRSPTLLDPVGRPARGAARRRGAVRRRAAAGDRRDAGGRGRPGHRATCRSGCSGQYELSRFGAARRRRRGSCSWRRTSSAPSRSSGWTARASCAGSRSTS